MEWQTFDLQFVQSVAPQAEKIVDVISYSNSYTLCVEGGFSEANVRTSGSLLGVASTIMTPQHGPLRARSEPSSVSDSGPAIESVSSGESEDCLSVPNPAAQVDVTSGHNILGEKRKLDQDQLSDIDAVDGDKGENHSILCVQMELTFWQRSPNCDLRHGGRTATQEAANVRHGHQDLGLQLSPQL